MREFSFLIPVNRDSDKQLHAPKVWQDLERDLASLYGGFTRRGIVAGGWIDREGQLVSDTSVSYSVAIPDDRESELYALLSQYRVRFDQQCLYVAETSSNARLL